MSKVVTAIMSTTSFRRVTQVINCLMIAAAEMHSSIIGLPVTQRTRVGNVMLVLYIAYIINCSQQTLPVIITATIGKHASQRTALSLNYPTTTLIGKVFTTPPLGVRSIVMTMSVCLFVCLSVRSRDSKIARPNFAIFVHVACGHSLALS